MKVQSKRERDSQAYVSQRSLYQKTKDAVTNYAVDVSAGTTFYTPIMVAGEYMVAGMSGEQVLKSRIGATLIHAICFRPIGMLRNASANYLGLTKDSPWYKKYASDVASTLMAQIPTYAGVLYSAGVPFDKGLKAMAIGTGLTIASGRIFGKFMDTWRGFWGKKKAIK